MSFSRFAEWLSSNKVARASGFPKRIYSLWIQGEDAAPDLVRFNWDRWSRLNPDYELVILDGPSALRHIGQFPIDPGHLSHQAFSDVLRAKLLADTGGVWVDASVFPVIPLAEWIDECLARSSFFAYEAPGDDRPLSSWFLAAHENSLIMKEWWSAVITYWRQPRILIMDESGRIAIPDDPVEAVKPKTGDLQDRYYYFWFHYLFAYLSATSPAFQAEWMRGCRKPASEPHRLQGFMIHNPDADAEALAGQARSAEMQKLNWRVSYPLDLIRLI
jgi:hypothetical protein